MVLSVIRLFAVHAATASSAASAAGRARRGLTRSPRRPVPSSAPNVPPATPATTARIVASGTMSPVQGRRKTAEVQPHSAAMPSVPVSTPATAPKASGRLISAKAAISIRIASGMYSAIAGVVSPKTGPTSSATQPRVKRKNSAAMSAPPRPIQMRAATSAKAAASETSIGWKTIRNCGTPKSNSPWKVERPISRPPIRPSLRSVPPGAFSVASSRDSDSRTAMPTSDMPAPPISIRCVGPQRVTSWPKSRCQSVVEREAGQREGAAGGHQDAADRGVPALGDADGARARALALLGQRDGDDAGGEDAEQADQDQVVRGIGERAGVAAVVDVQRDVPVHAQQGDLQGTAADAERERGVAGQARDAGGEVGTPAEEADAAGAVAGAEEDQCAGDDDRHAGGNGDLARRSATGRFAAGSDGG